MSLNEPLGKQSAKRLIRDILQNGTVRWSRHALDGMKTRKLTTVDCINVLRAGVVQSPELERGTWRYRMHGGWISVVVAFRSERELVVITAWRH